MSLNFSLFFRNHSIFYSNLVTTAYLGRPCTIVTGGLIKCSWCFFLFFFLFCHAFSDVLLPIAAKLCHTIGNCLDWIMQVQKFGGPSPIKIWGQKHAKFRSILYNLRLRSRISPERLKISKIGKQIFPDRFLLRSEKGLVNFGPLVAEN